MACDSLLMTSLFEVDCQNLLSTGFLQVVSTSLILTDLLQLNEIEKFVATC